MADETRTNADEDVKANRKSEKAVKMRDWQDLGGDTPDAITIDDAALLKAAWARIGRENEAAKP